jgi:putative transposase
MTLTAHEFIRRFLMHVLPKGLHRIRHYGLFAKGNRAANLAKARELLRMSASSAQPDDPKAATPEEPRLHPHPCPCYGGRMLIIEVFARGCEPSSSLTPIRIDT